MSSKNNMLCQLTDAVVTYDSGDPKRIQHLIKVHSLISLNRCAFRRRITTPMARQTILITESSQKQMRW